jgi:hypothetical protein
MADRVKFRVTITAEYASSPEYYDVEDPTDRAGMALVDLKNFEEDVGSLYGVLDSCEAVKITVEPI